MADDRMLQEAIDSINSGQRARARDLLTRLLRQDKNNIDYWLYLSTVVESKKERLFCLENVLKYDPGNQTAARGMVLMAAMPPADDLSPVRPVNERKWEVSEILEADGMSASEKQKPRTKLPVVQLVSLGVVGIVAVGLMAIGIFGNPFYDGLPFAFGGSGSGGQPLITSGPTPTYLPTNTPEGGLAHTPTVVGPTPLHFLLNATFTPTPRYVDTPHPESEAFKLGMRNFDLQNYPMAINFFKQHIQADPAALDARYYLAMSNYYLEEYEEARDIFLRIIEMDSAFAPAHLGVAQAWLAINPDRAVGDSLFKAVSIDQEYIEAHIARAQFRLKLGNAEGVLNDAQAILNIDPDHGWGQYYLAWALLEFDRKEEALEAAQRSQELDPTILENYLVLGHALVENGLEADALAPLQTYLSFVEDSGLAWFLVGRAHLASGFPQNALDAIETSVQYRKDFYEINYYRGAAYLGIGEYDQAILYLDSAIEVFPTWYEAYIALTETYYLKGDVQEANNIITNLNSLANTDERKASLYYWRALTFEELDFLDLAERDWNLLIDLPPEVVPPEWFGEASQHLQDLGGSSDSPSSFPTRVPTRTPNTTPTP